MIALAGCRFGFESGEPRDAAGSGNDPDALVDASGVAMVDAMPDGTSVTCPTSYVTIGQLSSRYRLITTSTVWLSAEQSCEADGTHLVIVDDATELAQVANALPMQ